VCGSTLTFSRASVFLLTDPFWSGKHSIKKDDFLTNIVQVPPKQHIPIAPFDSRTHTEAFAVSLEGLKGVRSDFLDSASTKVDSF
jgi:hypothetical protein